MRITPDDFKRATGRDADGDELCRVNCDKAGGTGHRLCGWNYTHNKPVFEVGPETNQEIDARMNKMLVDAGVKVHLS